jgi:hypothetical protein
MPTNTPTEATPAKGKDGAALDALQDAISDLDEAGRRAGGELRGQIEAITERLRGAAADLRDRATAQTKDFESSLERASEHLKVELGLRAIRVQDSPEALRQLSAEIRKRKAELTP